MKIEQRNIDEMFIDNKIKGIINIVKSNRKEIRISYTSDVYDSHFTFYSEYEFSNQIRKNKIDALIENENKNTEINNLESEFERFKILKEEQFSINTLNYTTNRIFNLKSKTQYYLFNKELEREIINVIINKSNKVEYKGKDIYVIIGEVINNIQLLSKFNKFIILTNGYNYEYIRNSKFTDYFKGINIDLIHTNYLKREDVCIYGIDDYQFTSKQLFLQHYKDDDDNLHYGIHEIGNSKFNYTLFSFHN